MVAVADPLVTNRIKAYVAAREPVEPADLLGFCRSRIPAYMVPESVELRAGAAEDVDRQDRPPGALAAEEQPREDPAAPAAADDRVPADAEQPAGGQVVALHVSAQRPIAVRGQCGMDLIEERGRVPLAAVLLGEDQVEPVDGARAVGDA